MKSVDAGKLPPNDLEAEAATLSVLMLDPGALDDVVDILKPDDMYSNSHRRIFEAILEVRGHGGTPDVVTVATHLKDNGRIGEIGGMEYLAQILNASPAVDVRRYGKIVKDKSKLRKLLALARLAIARVNAEPSVEIITDMARELADLADDREERGAVPILQALKEAVHQIKAAIDGGGISGLKTGVTDLDEMLTGLHDSDLYVFAGRPSMGKSALAFGALRHVCQADPEAGGMGFSLEMPYDQIALRLLCEEANVSVSLARSGKVQSSDWAGLLDAATRLGKLRDQLYLDSRPGVSVAQMRATTRRMQRDLDRAKKRQRFIVVDYIQLAREPRAQSREQEVAEVSRGLKEMAKEFAVPVLALAQLNRKCEERSDKRPMLSDLRDSGSIEQDADAVGFIYRDEVYNRTSADKGVAEIIISKQRNGPTGTVYAQFNGRTTAFHDLDETTRERLMSRHAEAAE